MIFTHEYFHTIQNELRYSKNNLKTRNKIINDLLAKETNEKNLRFLKKLRADSNDVRLPHGRVIEALLSEDEANHALLAFYHFNLLQNSFQKIRRILDDNLTLSHELNLDFGKLEKQLAQLDSQVYNHRFATMEYTFKNIKTSLFNFEQKHKKIKYNYPNSYFEIMSNSGSSLEKEIDSIKQVIALFEDYYEKNHFYYLHWRSHNSTAESICSNLKKIIDSTEKPQEKQKKAMEFLLNEKNQLAEKNKIGRSAQNSSSFFRRANFALEMLNSAVITQALKL